MVKLKRLLPATTIIEVIVAALIMMIVFTISIDTLSRILLSPNSELLIIEAENNVSYYVNQYDIKMDEEVIEFRWGRLKITKTQYNDKLDIVNYEANILDTKRGFTYFKIIPKLNNR